MKHKLQQAYNQNKPTLVMVIAWCVMLAGICGFMFFTLKDGATFKQAIIPVLLFAGCVAAVIFIRQPLSGIYILIAGMPILAADFLNTRVINMAGMKLDVILPAGVLFCLLISQCKTSMRKTETKFILCVLAVFFIAYLRGMEYALPYLSTDILVTRGSYLRSYVLKDFLYFLPFILICVYFNSERQVELLIKAVFWGITILGIFIAVIFVIYIRPLGDFEVSKAYYSVYYSGHPNDIANTFLVAFPLMLGYAFYRKKAIYYGAVGICLVAIVLLFSRTVYVLVAVATVVFLLMEKKIFLLIAGAFAGGASIPVWPDSIKKYAMTLVRGDNLNTLTSGRTENIWRPLLQELSGYSLPRWLFGYGSYGVFKTNSYQAGDIFTIAHAHNVYLNTILDTGLVGLAVFLVLFVYYLWQFFRASRLTKNPFFSMMLRCICMAVVLYLIRGLSGGFFLPQLSNMYLWISIGIGIVILKVESGKGGEQQDADNKQAQEAGHSI